MLNYVDSMSSNVESAWKVCGKCVLIRGKSVFQRGKLTIQEHMVCKSAKLAPSSTARVE